ncbi:hypothetical protein [Vampirovibrio sp.]|uniref:hypothetical protein n=1 Tax=Vampirovibrio sp. TaxID=2717857 RepID=UPI00359343B5
MNTQALVEEIQKRHQVSLKPNDPIFAVLTLNELLLANHMEQIQVALEQQKNLLNEGSAERINTGFELVSEQANQVISAMNGTFQEAGNALCQKLDQTLSARLREFEKKAEGHSKASISLATILPQALIAVIFFALGIVFKSYIWP